MLKAATRLFTAQGINATGMDQLSTVAEVSKRTLCTHFPSKDELIGAYLQSVVDDLLPVSPSPAQPAPSPREQLLAVFDWELPKTTAPFRGCPFLNVSVEVPDPGHSVHQLAAAYKREFARRLTDIARQAGAVDRAVNASYDDWPDGPTSVKGRRRPTTGGERGWGACGRH
ncbi:TetR/AcrR family transcriptional regulator [Streptomyces cellulosae]|uniref:TetR/AcrR family transcriptional regulator n=1 Tax=Streptomyces cellulosae TaxID=1968 RepID=A0ABW7XUP8_STRCE